MDTRTAKSLELEGKRTKLPAPRTKTLFGSHKHFIKFFLKINKRKHNLSQRWRRHNSFLKRNLFGERGIGEVVFLQRLHLLIFQLGASHSESPAT